MKNVVAKVEGSILTLMIDLSKSQGPSKSGKSTVVATTGGNVPLSDLAGVGSAAGYKVGLNVYRK